MVRSPLEPLAEQNIKAALRDIPLGGVRYISTTTSTNDLALEWAATRACPQLGLVVAEEQTAGRGRKGRQWVTVPGASLAFSLIIQPMKREMASIPLYSGLGALAVSEAISSVGYEAEIKWPNDILIDGRKICGILPEAVWVGEKLTHVILGIGVNVRIGSVPQDRSLEFPATSLESESGSAVDRVSLLREIIKAFFSWRGLLGNDVFVRTWEERLAFRGKKVELKVEGNPPITGRLDGLGRDGSLQLSTSAGDVMAVQFGEVHLRPVL